MERGGGRRRLLAFLACGAAAAGAGAGPQAWPRPLSSDQRAAILEAHNSWRARVGVRPVRWSTELAQGAQRWADTLARRGCRLSHDSRTSDGENLFWTSPVEGRDAPLDPVTPATVVEFWGHESQFYSHRRNTCARGRSCGHYLQLVWDETREVGCAYSICGDLGQVWVCRYRPGRVGSRRPY